MNLLKSKLTLILLLGLTFLQISLAVSMNASLHQETCAFDEHCILQSIVQTETAVPPLLTIVIPSVLALVLASHVEFKRINFPAHAVDFSLRRTLKGVIQKE